MIRFGKMILAAVWKMSYRELRVEARRPIRKLCSLQERGGRMDKGSYQGDEEIWILLPKAVVLKVLNAAGVEQYQPRGPMLQAVSGPFLVTCSRQGCLLI